MKKITIYLFSFALIVFASLTLYLSGSLIFDLFNVREQQGNFVPFVIWTNFICGFIYLSSVYGIIKQNKNTYKLLGAAFLLIIVTFIAFNIYINQGGIHEVKTFGALIFRLILTGIFTLLAYYLTHKKV